MSPIEWIAALLGIANILLLVGRSIWNYPFGIATVALQGWLFYGGHLYSDALLQIFFLVLNVYGWVNWTRARQDEGVPVRWISPAGAAGCIAATLVATAGWGFLMHRYTDAAFPWWDAAVAMMSIMGQILLARRYIDNWLWWIAVNVAAIPLYWIKDLHLISGLYALNLLLSIVGLIGWMRARRPEPVLAVA